MHAILAKVHHEVLLVRVYLQLHLAIAGLANA